MLTASAMHAHGGSGYLDINGRLELLDVLVQGLGLSPACLCQVGVLVDDPNIMKAFSMSHKMYHL